jgi:hypothetical protein
MVSPVPKVPAVTDPEAEQAGAEVINLEESTKELLKAIAERNQENPATYCETKINKFLQVFFRGTSVLSKLILPKSINLNYRGTAELASLPEDGQVFENSVVTSYRLFNGQGILHKPIKDKRTTAGIFHVAEGGFLIPDDKKGVPPETSARLVAAALNPGWRPGDTGELDSAADLMKLPWDNQTQAMVSCTIRPVVSPKIEGVTDSKYMEIQVYAPAGLTANVDFLQKVFTEPGTDAFKDAGLDIERFSGHSGCIIFAPHLIHLTKKELGLPHYDQASERQKADKMCYKNEDEKYNDGNAFKLCIRDASGQYVMLVADNYFGYGKKGVKDILSYVANLTGKQEIHAGGAIVYPRNDLGDKFIPTSTAYQNKEPPSINSALSLLSDQVEITECGESRPFAKHKEFHNLLFIPEGAVFDKIQGKITWDQMTLPLEEGVIYGLPSGYRVELIRDISSSKNSTTMLWRLIGTDPEGVVFHKPDSVSGAGKSEISKPLQDAMRRGLFIISDLEKSLERIRKLSEVTWEGRFKHGKEPGSRNAVITARKIFDEGRILASLIKLLTKSENFTAYHNLLLDSIHPETKELIYLMKQLYNNAMPLEEFFSRFSVDKVNGRSSSVLKYNGEEVSVDQIRVGTEDKETSRYFTVNPSFAPSKKYIREDDISMGANILTAKVKGWLGRAVKELNNTVVFIVQNIERALFQRPDDAHVPGYDKIAERDFARRGGFYTNYEPLPLAKAAELASNKIGLSKYTQPVQQIIENAAAAHSRGEQGYFVIPSHRRIVDGQPTANPRYLQIRPDLLVEDEIQISNLLTKLRRELSYDSPFISPVDLVVPGRRLNKEDRSEGKTIRSLAVMAPIHYQEFPEYLAELFTSLTGKSPSTTGSRSFERARTKGPFNSLPGLIDIEDAMVSMILSGKQSFISAAGYVGPKYKVDHDITLLMTEMFGRLLPHERSVEYFIEKGWLEKIADYEGTIQVIREDRTAEQTVIIPASILGWRLSTTGRDYLLGTTFSDPEAVVPDDMLFPETQIGNTEFSDGILNIFEAQCDIATEYFADGSVEYAAKPIKALLHIMKDGYYDDPESGQKWKRDTEAFRKLFSKEAILESDWYNERLKTAQFVEVHTLKNRLEYLENLEQNPDSARQSQDGNIEIATLIAAVQENLEAVSAANYIDSLRGTPGIHTMVESEMKRLAL